MTKMKQPSMFAKSLFNQPPLHAETAQLEDYLANRARDPEVVAMEAKLREAREARAIDAATFRDQCEEWRTATSNNNAALPAATLALEGRLREQDARINAMRVEIKAAKLEWAPKFFNDVKPYLTATTPTLLEAAATIEAAAAHFDKFDKFVQDSGIGDWISPRARRLEDIARNLRAFTEGKK